NYRNICAANVSVLKTPQASGTPTSVHAAATNPQCDETTVTSATATRAGAPATASGSRRAVSGRCPVNSVSLTRRTAKLQPNPMASNPTRTYIVNVYASDGRTPRPI